MAKANPILYNRQTKELEEENAYKSGGLKFLYNTGLGKTITRTILVNKRISKLYGRYMNSPRSVKKIQEFIGHYDINVGEVKEPLSHFKSFNDFFIRELKDNARPIDTTPEHLISPADSKLFIFDLSKNPKLPVKGYWYKIEDLVKDAAIAKDYEDGWCFIYRLAPNDYHRYAYIDNGTQDAVIKLNGVLHSVNPIALKAQKNVMSKNYRELTMLHTENFGTVAHIEVGALFVGKIINHHYQAHQYTRAEEKGYFEFGGSTVIQLFKKDAIIPDADLIHYSEQGIETIVKLGEKTGIRK